MISILFLSIINLFILSNNFKFINEKEEVLISNYITAFILSISTVGLISMALIFFELTKLPIYLIILLTTIIYVFFFKIRISNILNFLKSIKLFFKIFLENFKDNKLIIFITLWLFFISFGPINHPDTITTYAGYPYQFFLHNKHFVDGGLHQGLLGISDFANISFFQEGTSWLIRSIQAIPLLLLVAIFLKRKTKNLLILCFLTCPVFIQWLTIGKYLFLPDVGITITYLVWSRLKDKNSLFNLLIVILLSLTFKISCLIISIPIIFHLIYDYYKNIKIISFNLRGNLSRLNFFLFSIVALFIILFYRLNITGNIFYPIFNSFFISDNQEMVNFENNLRNYMRSSSFPLSLMITNNINLLGMIIGPATGFYLLSIIFVNISQLRNKFLSCYKLVGISQLILLLILSQGRGDYFAAPIILIFISENNYLDMFIVSLKRINLKTYLIRFVPSSLLYFQISIFLCITLVSGYQTIFSLFDYSSYMNRYAFNYDLTNTLNKYAKEPIMSMGNRTALLFLNKEYVHEDSYKKCMNKEKDILTCATKLKANSLISYNDEFNLNKKYQCQKYNSIKTSRNPFRLKKRMFHICNVYEPED